MSMAGKLKVEAGRFGSVRRAWLVSEEDARPIGRAAGQRRNRIAGLRCIEGTCRKISHSSQYIAGATVGDDDVTVVQAAQSDPLELAHPGCRTG